MTDKKNNQNKYPRATVGAFIENKEGKILLIRSPKWLEGNLWLCPGGGINYGESPEEAVVREVKEELGLDLKEPEFIQVVNGVDPKEFMYPGHFVGIDYKFKLVDENQEMNLDSREVIEAEWFTLEDILNRDDIETTTRESVEKMLEMKKSGKHSLFHKHCKDCEKNKKEADEFKAGWQRAQADYQNLKKESENMRGEWVRMSEQQIVEDFLPVYDNFSKAFATGDTDTQISADVADNADVKKFENWKKGIEYIMKQYWKVLQDHGVDKIKTVGEMFDTTLHEAVGEEPASASSSAEATADNKATAGKGLVDNNEQIILKEVEAGYVMKGKVIKVAKVIISKIK